MNIPKAIEILQDLDTTLPQSSPEDRREAVRLGIEAMKRLKIHREHSIPGPMFLLPGETEDEPDEGHPSQTPARLK